MMETIPAICANSSWYKTNTKFCQLLWAAYSAVSNNSQAH